MHLGAAVENTDCIAFREEGSVRIVKYRSREYVECSSKKVDPLCCSADFAFCVGSRDLLCCASPIAKSR